MKYFFVLFLPIILSASLTYNSNHQTAINILESLDIEASFLNDPWLHKIKNDKSNISKEKHFFTAMDNAYLFIPAIKDILNQYDIPQEFLYLAMAESNFKTKAYSRKRASGLWQFMPGTGRNFNLKIDQYVDERRDLIKSTEAAAKYLTVLHKKFGKWYLAAIAYNCGGARLERAIKKAGSDSLAVLLNHKKKYIPRESRNYIRKIVALALIGNDEEFMLKSEYEHLLNRANAYSIATIKLSKGESLKRVADILNMPFTDLQKLNRHLKYDFVPPYAKNYEVYIPYIKLSEFKQKYFKPSMQKMYHVHIVSKGDNLSYIGKRYGVSYRVIKDFNKLKTNRLRIKQKLIIPVAQKPKRKKVDSKFYYMVKEGDSLGTIARDNHISVKNLKAINNINGSLIRVGDRLKLYE